MASSPAKPKGSDRLTPEMAKEMAQRKVLLRAALAGSAPGVIALVILVSLGPGLMGLGKVGLLSVAALFFVLAHLVWRRQWWATLPTISLFAGLTVYFVARLLRPMLLYYASNPPMTVQGLTAPLIMLSPYLVVLPLAIVFTVYMYKALKLARELGPLPVSRHIWIVTAMWVVLLLMDLLFKF